MGDPWWLPTLNLVPGYRLRAARLSRTAVFQVDSGSLLSADIASRALVHAAGFRRPALVTGVDSWRAALTVMTAALDGEGSALSILSCCADLPEDCLR